MRRGRWAPSVGEPLRWNHLLGFAFIVAGAYFVFHKF